jgi:hypothetical protein
MLFDLSLPPYLQLSSFVTISSIAIALTFGTGTLIDWLKSELFLVFKNASCRGISSSVSL